MFEAHVPVIIFQMAMLQMFQVSTWLVSSGKIESASFHDLHPQSAEPSIYQPTKVRIPPHIFSPQDC